jgi:hypothetical protein
MWRGLLISQGNADCNEKMFGIAVIKGRPEARGGCRD